MKINFVPLTLITVLVFSCFVTISQAHQGTSTADEDPVIVIDGDLSDWTGIAPLATDPAGDTAAWSKNGTTGVGTTAETPAQIPLADEARDLRAFYAWFGDPNWLCFRLDVENLSLPNVLLNQTHAPAPNAYTNFTAYDLIFDLGPANGPPPPPAGFGWNTDPYPDGIDASSGSQPWEFFIQLALFGTNPYVAAAQPPWSSGWFPGIQTGPPGTINSTQVQIAWNLTSGSVEFAINRTSVEALYPDHGPLKVENLFIYSWKPGEPTGGWGSWPHAFDPDQPGGAGENVGGHDMADYFEVMGTMGTNLFEGPCWQLDMAIHDVAVISVTPSPTEVNVGESVNITVVVMSNGSVAETFNVTVSYDGTDIDTQTVTDLAAGAQRTLNFTWDTTGVALGNYTIEAVAETVTGETYTANNAKISLTEIKVIPEFPTWASILLILVVLTVAIAIHKRRPLKTPIH